jgi:hypothetical protein
MRGKKKESECKNKIKITGILNKVMILKRVLLEE